jgi:hypothetical protein
MKKRELNEREKFEDAMHALFKAPKPPKHVPKRRKKKGKD